MKISRVSLVARGSESGLIDHLASYNACRQVYPTYRKKVLKTSSHISFRFLRDRQSWLSVCFSVLAKQFVLCRIKTVAFLLLL